MNDFLDRIFPIIGGLLVILASVLLPLLVYIVLWVLPHAIYNESTCLAAGFPKAATTFSGRGYCMNLQGSVTIQVAELD